MLENTNTAMAHVWMVTASSTRADQLNTGCDWLGLHLATTPTGVALYPISQALQEYPEMESLHARVHRMLAPHGGTVQILARLGHAAPVPPSPRGSPGNGCSAMPQTIRSWLPKATPTRC